MPSEPFSPLRLTETADAVGGRPVAVSAAPLLAMHWTTWIAVSALGLVTLTEAALSATGWATTLPGAIGVVGAVVAVGFLLIVFVGLPHLAAHVRAGNFFRAALLALGLVAAMCVEVEGGHRGIGVLIEPMRAQVEAERVATQQALDAERGALEDEIALLRAQIDTAAASNPGVTYTTRMQQWLRNFEAITAADRDRLTDLSERLATLPRTVDAADPYPPWTTYAAASIFAYFAMFGLMMFGVTVSGPDTQPSSQRVAKAVATELSRLRPNGASKRRDESEQHCVATRGPPLDETQVREAITALIACGETISLQSVAAFHGVPKSRADRSPAKHLILEQSAGRRANRRSVR